MREVYLIGVNHMYQFGPDGRIVRFGPPAIFAQFRQFLTETIAALGICGIGEEMSRAALRKHSISGDSVPCRLAAELGLPHRYCDPEPEIQKRLSIVSDEQREKCWIQELMSLDVFPVLFVLGAAHIDSFQVLLRACGLAPVIVARDWQPPAGRDAGCLTKRWSQRRTDLLMSLLVVQPSACSLARHRGHCSSLSR